MKNMTICLWYDNQAEEAVRFYQSIFKDLKITGEARYTEGGMGKSGTVMTMTFKLLGQEYMALNGGPVFHFTEAISLIVNCENQVEVDDLWEKLSEGGEKSQCGWLKDKFGLSWQIVPTRLGELMQDPDPEKVKRVTMAMLKMTRLDIAGLEAAYNQL
jgi:predicted 3-demethylubiquinone-9 3-methyltransferase (glyoxalase superfamily)